MQQIELNLCCVVITVFEDNPFVFLTDHKEPKLPVEEVTENDINLQKAVRDKISHSLKLDLGYVEQLYTFGDKTRTPMETTTKREVSIAYVALVKFSPYFLTSNYKLSNIYSFFPWEDSRKKSVVGKKIKKQLLLWAQNDKLKKERVAISFGDQRWDEEKVLDRYELLYEACLVEESYKDKGITQMNNLTFGTPMYKDHRRILATALGRIRGKIKYRPVVFELLPETFTLTELQKIVEALLGVYLHTQNFRRLVSRSRLVEKANKLKENTGGRPAELYKFRKEVLLERPYPGVGIKLK